MGGLLRVIGMVLLGVGVLLSVPVAAVAVFGARNMALLVSFVWVGLILLAIYAYAKHRAET
jgi:hypothetical protein